MIERKYIVLSLSTLVSILLGGLFYSSTLAQPPGVTEYISVPAADFVPQDNTKKALIVFYLVNLEDDEHVMFSGAVQLPNGARITNVTVYWYDVGTTYDVQCRLWRVNQTHYWRMAILDSSGSAGYGFTYDNDVDYATVDNSQYAYHFTVLVPCSASHQDYYFQYAVIEYTRLPVGG